MADFLKLGYANVRTINGVVCGIQPMLYTTGLFVGLDEHGYERRYCYEHYADAVLALSQWDGEDDPPGPWVKEKPSNRLGPGAVS